VAYTVIDHEGVARIHVSSIESGETRVLLGTEGASHPVWSPAEDALLFAARQRLKRLDLSNGSVRDLIRIGFPGQTVWNQNDDIVARIEGKLVRVSGQGDNSTPIPNSSLDMYPAFLRDGEVLVFGNSETQFDSARLPRLGERTLLVDNVQARPFWRQRRVARPTFCSADSHLFAQDSTRYQGKS
jgi:hypothetical protein